MFKGVYTALVTPFLENKKVDYASLKKLLWFQEQSNVNGVVLLGTTAEECTLTTAECIKIIKCSLAILKTKEIVVGISGNCTASVVNKLRLYNKFNNIKGFLIGTPYYNKPTSAGLVNHFTKIAQETTKPIILYNIPSRCGVKLDFDTLIQLKSCKNVVAIKEASGDIDYFTKLIAEFGDRYSILCGNDNIFLPMLSCGAVGCISVVSNILPSIPVNIYKNYVTKLEKCIFLHNKFNLFINNLFIETNPACIKYVLSKYGFCNNILREPLMSISKQSQIKIDGAIKDLFNV